MLKAASQIRRTRNIWKHVFYYFILIPHQFFWFNFFPFEAEALKKTLLLKIHKGGFIFRYSGCDGFAMQLSTSLSHRSVNARHR
jgi:hypothetical protein